MSKMDKDVLLLAVSFSIGIFAYFLFIVPIILTTGL
jgi:hypothetical protein